MHSPGKARASEASHSGAGRTKQENLISSHRDQTRTTKTARYDNKLQCSFSSFANKFSSPTVRGERSTRRSITKQQNWSMITNDPYILEIVQGYKLDLVETPFQLQTPKQLIFSKSETDLLDNEIRELRAKNAVRVVQPPRDSL